jgi:DNA-binding transcriptional ArsR family regulator
MVKTNMSPDLDDIFEALANHHRREIMYALGLQPHSISQLASMQHLSLPAIHKHIKILEEAKMIIRKKTGRSNFLALNRNSLRSLQDWLTQYHTYWGNNEESLENYNQYLEKDPPTLKLRPSARRSPTARRSRRGKEGGEEK